MSRAKSALTLVMFIPLLGHSSAHPNPSPGPSSTDFNTIQFINEVIKNSWTENNIVPSPNANGNEMLRRVYLDIIGRIPTVDEIRTYSRRDAENRYADEVRRLLNDEDYARNWANLWTAWLLTRTSPRGINREATRHWLEESFTENTPYDKFVKEILTATGESHQSGAVNFVASHVGERNPRDLQGRDGIYDMTPVTSRTSRLFLGVQVQCIQCHDHPSIPEKKQSEFWGLNAFFRQVELDEPSSRNDDTRRWTALRDNLDNNPEAGVFFERRTGVLLRTPLKYLDGSRIRDGESLNRRRELAELITSDDQFARAYVNRMWAHFFGRGFTQPFDDFGEHNPVSHPELLERLANDFVDSGYDSRRLIGWICNSDPYRLSSRRPKGKLQPDAEMYFARMQLKAMTPEQLVDSILTATNMESTLPDSTQRADNYRDWLRDFSVNFGDDEGNEATFNGTVIQALMLMNGPKLNEAIKFKKGSTLYKALSRSSSTKQIDHLYLAVLSRKPTPRERRMALDILNVRSQDRSGPWQDILWALLNSNEFFLNH